MSARLLHRDVEQSVHQLRAALKTLLVGIGSDPARPQEVHRRLGVDRGLCWKISRVVRARAAEDALQHMPGSEAFGNFLEAIERIGAESADLQLTRDAIRGLNETVESHIGDRRTLELMLDSASPRRDGLILSRKLAFRGNSGVWGVQARTRAQMLFLAPNDANPDLIDTATIAGWIDFKRLRPNANWRVFHRRSLSSAAQTMEPIDPSQAAGGPMLIERFCRNVPPLVVTPEGQITHYEIGPSPAGAAGAFTLYSGFAQRAQGSRWADEPGDIAQFAAHILAPVEYLVFDLLVHCSLPFAQEASMFLSSAAFNDGMVRTPFLRLPIQPDREELRTPPVVACSQAPQWDEVLDCVLEARGWKMHDFAGVRYQVAFPPFPSVAVVELPLAMRPR